MPLQSWKIGDVCIKTLLQIWSQLRTCGYVICQWYVHQTRMHTHTHAYTHASMHMYASARTRTILDILSGIMILHPNTS